jgi:ferredoxin-type protein NapH
MRLPRWLIARRAMQIGLLAAFAGAPWIAQRWVEGTLASSRWFGRMALSDPFVVLQSWFAGHAVAASALAGASAITLFFGLVAGRLYCGWVCPINLVTDAADALRRATGWRRSLLPRADRRLRYGVLAAVLIASTAAGALVWEALNPIAHAVRAMAFGLWGGGAVAVSAVFLFDVVLLRHGWCGHLCPVGAFYGLVGRFGRLQVDAPRAAACSHCGDCFDTCPVPHVIAPVLRPGAATTTIVSIDCLRCGRCDERCGEQVFDWRLGAMRR